MSTRPRMLFTVSGYACEGGHDGRHQPATCYCPSIALGRHAGPGAAEGLWQDYEDVLDVASDAGLEGISLEVSWARLEHRQGLRDDVVMARYADVVTYAQRRGLWVNVAAIDAAWPSWLGLEAWLMPWVISVAVEYTNWLFTSLPADSFSIFASRDRLTRGFVDDRAAPPWRRGAHDDARSANDNLAIIEQRVRDADLRPVTTAVNVELDEADVQGVEAVDEVHVRSLVRGSGPLRADWGLLARKGDEWVVTDPEIAKELGRR